MKKKLKKEIAELRSEIQTLQEKIKILEELETKIKTLKIDVEELQNPLLSNPAVQAILFPQMKKEDYKLKPPISK